MIDRGPIVCCAMSLGYGPAGKLLAIAERLDQHRVPLIFLGSGIALELVARNGDLFESVQCCRAEDESAWNVIRSSAGMLSIMDREFAPLAIRARKPLHVVDSLLWMRPDIPTEFRDATTYWAQQFMPFPIDISFNSIAVGPIVPSSEPSAESSSAARIGCVVNLGGCQSSREAGAIDLNYTEFVVNGLLSAQESSINSLPITVTTGERCRDNLQARFGGLGIEFASIPHRDFQRWLHSTSVVLTSPGLTTTLECFAAGVPTYFLPPQSYSQWCILRHLREKNVADSAFHWEDHRSDRLEDRLPASIRNPVVRDAIESGIDCPSAKATFRESLERIDQSPAARQALVTRQRLFFDSLGENGAESIAQQLSQMLDVGRRG